MHRVPKKKEESLVSWSPEEVYGQGWGIDPVGKVPIMQAQGPEFRCLAPTLKPGIVHLSNCIIEKGGEKQEDSQASLSQQPSKFMILGSKRKPVSKNKGEYD